MTEIPDKSAEAFPNLFQANYYQRYYFQQIVVLVLCFLVHLLYFHPMTISELLYWVSTVR